MATKKILTITVEVEVLERRTRAARLKAAHEAAVNAAVEAVRGELLDGSVGDVKSRMTWDYRWADTSAQYAGDEEEPWIDDAFDEGEDESSASTPAEG
ncbi:MAG: hypothetical protein FWE75_11510, partial [Actinomycetia bacterium]|nr:hypothetical protein [Actinomycetes bacterium]